MTATGGPGVTGPQGRRSLKFREVSEWLRRGILAGTWPVGDRLPTEQQLVRSTGYSLNTVRRGVDDLVADGLVERRQGAGTFVMLQRRSGPRGRVNIGVMLPGTSQYFPTVLQGVSEALTQAGASLQLASYAYRPEREDDCIERLLAAEVDGLLLVPTLAGLTDPGHRVRQLGRLPVPVVMLERSLPELGPADRSEYVCSDHEGGAYDAVQHLHRLGHRRIALLLRDQSATRFGVHAGHRRAASDLDLPTLPVLRADADQWRRTRAEGVLDALLAQHATAALVFGDSEATLLLNAARRRGIAVPEELALVSYDDETADIADVPLTAVSPPKHRIGRMAAEILLQRLAEGAECPLHQVRLRPELVVRESCGAALDSGPLHLEISEHS